MTESCMTESKAKIQEKMNINLLILDKFINKCLCIYLLLF